MKRIVARSMGIALQSAVLGVGLFLAICKIVAFASDARVFRYQGF